ncbi:MAG TPA: twin-arginine translocase TatA/TatE family subunit [Bacteroidetes bacterium]|nr:twin-arginine translocase TatA/TatE family subunit [Bacteroidota bacterium]
MNLFIIAGMIGPWQIVLIVVILLLLFGGRKIPELMKGLGQGLKEFKKATSQDDEDTGGKTEDSKKLEKE